jgi:hypothetical protein
MLSSKASARPPPAGGNNSTDTPPTRINPWPHSHGVRPTVWTSRRWLLQVPDFGRRFWVHQVVDLRTDSFVQLGAMYGTTRRGRSTPHEGHNQREWVVRLAREYARGLRRSRIGSNIGRASARRTPGRARERHAAGRLRLHRGPPDRRPRPGPATGRAPPEGRAATTCRPLGSARRWCAAAVYDPLALVRIRPQQLVGGRPARVLGRGMPL